MALWLFASPENCVWTSQDSMDSASHLCGCLKHLRPFSAVQCGERKNINAREAGVERRFFFFTRRQIVKETLCLLPHINTIMRTRPGTNVLRRLQNAFLNSP